MKMMLLGIAVILFGSGFIIPDNGGFALFGIAASFVGLIIVLVGYFLKDEK